MEGGGQEARNSDSGRREIDGNKKLVKDFKNLRKKRRSQRERE